MKHRRLTAALQLLSAIASGERNANAREWSAAANVGPSINSEFNERFPTISGDGLALYFASDRPGGRGSFDIYVSRRRTTADP